MGGHAPEVLVFVGHRLAEALAHLDALRRDAAAEDGDRVIRDAVHADHVHTAERRVGLQSTQIVKATDSVFRDPLNYSMSWHSILKVHSVNMWIKRRLMAG